MFEIFKCYRKTVSPALSAKINISCFSSGSDKNKEFSFFPFLHSKFIFRPCEKSIIADIVSVAWKMKRIDYILCEEIFF